MSYPESWIPEVGEIDRAVGSYIPAHRVAAIRTLIRDAVMKALAEQRQRFIEPPLAREQPCGCVVCVCDDDERCYGCGAKNCDDPSACVLRLGDRNGRAYRDAPSYGGLLAKLAEQEARHRREVLEARIEEVQQWGLCGDRDDARHCPTCAYVAALRAELAALAGQKVRRATLGEAERDRLKRLLPVARFGMKCFDGHREGLGDLDGSDLQEWAEACGLLHEVHVTEPCGDSCRCAEWDDFPQECLRETDDVDIVRTELAALDAEEEKKP